MFEKNAKVNILGGLSARAAAQFVQEANRYTAEIFVLRDQKKVNAKSIMGILSLAIPKGADITISAEGTDAEQAVEALVDFLSRVE